MDAYEWDEAKNLVNIEKHGIDFEDGIAIFEGPTVIREDARFDYGEPRYIALGATEGQVLVAVFTERDDRRRIISIRKASRNERREYYAKVAERPPDRSD